VYAVASVVFRGITGDVRGAHDIGDALFAGGDGDKTDADADIEGIIPPGKAEFLDPGEQALRGPLGDLGVTALEQDAEFIAAQARNGIRVADSAAQYGGKLAQKLVTGDMTAGVINDLELVKIHITKRVLKLAGFRRVHRFSQPTLEFAPVDQPGQVIMTGLIG